MDFRIEPGLRAGHRAAAAQGYWQAFSRKLRYPLGPEEKALTFIGRALNPDCAISAISGDGGFLGVAGFKSETGAFVGGGLADLAAVYGWPGAILRALPISLLERPCEVGTLLMDGIFVQPQARGAGVGSALLDAVEALAARLGMARVRLDVIDTNPRARALYERRGYRETARTSLGPLRHVFGFGAAATMTKQIGAPAPAGCPAT